MRTMRTRESVVVDNDAGATRSVRDDLSRIALYDHVRDSQSRLERLALGKAWVVLGLLLAAALFSAWIADGRFQDTGLEWRGNARSLDRVLLTVTMVLLVPLTAWAWLTAAVFKKFCRTGLDGLVELLDADLIDVPSNHLTEAATIGRDFLSDVSTRWRFVLPAGLVIIGGLVTTMTVMADFDFHLDERADHLALWAYQFFAIFALPMAMVFIAGLLVWFLVVVSRVLTRVARSCDLIVDLRLPSGGFRPVGDLCVRIAVLAAMLALPGLAFAGLGVVGQQSSFVIIGVVEVVFVLAIGYLAFLVPTLAFHRSMQRALAEGRIRPDARTAETASDELIATLARFPHFGIVQAPTWPIAVTGWVLALSPGTLLASVVNSLILKALGLS